MEKNGTPAERGDSPDLSKNPVALAKGLGAQGCGCLLLLFMAACLLLPWVDVGLATRSALNYISGWAICFLSIPTMIVLAWSIATVLGAYKYLKNEKILQAEKKHQKASRVLSGLALMAFGVLVIVVCVLAFISNGQGHGKHYENFSGIGVFIVGILCFPTILVGVVGIVLALLSKRKDSAK